MSCFGLCIFVLYKERTEAGSRATNSIGYRLSTRCGIGQKDCGPTIRSKTVIIYFTMY